MLRRNEALPFVLCAVYSVLPSLFTIDVYSQIEMNNETAKTEGSLNLSKVVIVEYCKDDGKGSLNNKFWRIFTDHKTRNRK
jgi:hypothetical protein